MAAHASLSETSKRWAERLAERYEQTMARIEQITRTGYLVKIQWECQFDEAQIVEQKPELLAQPIDTHHRSPEMFCTGVEPKPCASTIRYGRKISLSSIVT
jgi:G:T-mismatch repair DNA endonuclease (very short patch repair protein)